MPVKDDATGPRQKRSGLDWISQARWLRWALGLRLVRLAVSPAQGDSGFNKFVRYSLVSGVAIVISQVTILICLSFDLSGIMSNTIGALAATPASYELNRKWAWGKSGKSHLWREVVPFWSLSLTGFLASTGTVELADNFCRSHHIHHLGRSLTIMGASLFAYGVIWIVKFVIFNKLFVPHQDGGPEEGEPLVGGSPAGPVALASEAPRSTPGEPEGHEGQAAQTPAGVTQ